ncbi:ABC1 kinase family protein [Flexithrix dorotheae]|uniref:ABC1 kinase family protein n=1 Tax=Flexithrix dorotheae TaxID=70993 RepID=UPI00036F76E9|nr:AarF/ABC1/UbiB kinase family protein [Flexithrix dorotheae]
MSQILYGVWLLFFREEDYKRIIFILNLACHIWFINIDGRIYTLNYFIFRKKMLFKTVKKSNRIWEVIQVLLRYGFEDIVTTTRLSRFIPTQSRVNWIRAEKSVFEYTRWERIRMVIEDLGPTFVKLAQVLSNRPELLPEPLVVEFQKLQDKVPPFSSEQAREIVEKEIGQSIDDLFVYFDEVTLGSASIGQVHRARLISGEDVVIKVQRPKAEVTVKTDLALLKDLVKILENFFLNQGILNPLEIVDTFEKIMLSELDYETEAINLISFKKLYGDHPEFYIPKTFKEFSTKKILVIEFVSGCKISDKIQLEAWGLSPKVIAEKGMDIYLTQIFEFGFFHADPHPGNVLIRPNGTIVLIDFGMVGKLTRQNKYAFAGVFIGLAQQDAKGMAINLRRLAVDSDIDDMRAFENDLYELIEDMVIYDYEEGGMTELTIRLQELIYKYQLKVPGSIFMILRALAILEGIGNILHPNFKALEFIKPYGAKLLKEQFSVKNLGLDLYYTSSQLSALLYNLPFEIRSILKKIRKGNLNLNIDISGLDTLNKGLDYAAHTIVLGLISAALFIGTSVSINSRIVEQMPTLFGLPWLTFLGFALSAFFAVMLFFHSFRNNK